MAYIETIKDTFEVKESFEEIVRRADIPDLIFIRVTRITINKKMITMDINKNYILYITA